MMLNQTKLKPKANNSCIATGLGNLQQPLLSSITFMCVYSCLYSLYVKVSFTSAMTASVARQQQQQEALGSAPLSSRMFKSSQREAMRQILTVKDGERRSLSGTLHYTMLPVFYLFTSTGDGERTERHNRGNLAAMPGY